MGGKVASSHPVAAGDHLTRVAAANGFRSYGPLWNDPENAALRKQRHNPHILAVGDSVHIRELILQEVDRPTDKRHRFKAELHPIVVRLDRRRWDNKPVEPAPNEVLLDGKAVMFFERGPGKIEVPITATVDRCLVKTGPLEDTFRIGFLQPSDTVPGQRQRLENLGYVPGDSDDPTKVEFRSAVEEFQCDHGLLVDGKVGPVTRTKLAAVHGS